MKSKLEVIKNSSVEKARYFHHNLMKEINKDSLRNNFLTNGLSTQVRYTNGINTKSNFVFHKEEKWICYLCYDNIIIESLEEACDYNQIVFNYSERLQEISNFDNNDLENNNIKKNSNVLNEEISENKSSFDLNILGSLTHICLFLAILCFGMGILEKY
mgnify:CR=1 FL=1